MGSVKVVPDKHTSQADNTEQPVEDVEHQGTAP